MDTISVRTADHPPTTSSIRTIDRVTQTVHEMFIDRGYKIVDRSSWSKEFQQCADLRVVASNPHEIVFIYFATDVKVSVQKVRLYLTHMEENKVSHAMIVCAHQITPGAKQELSKRFDIETFQARELFENKTRHNLVPKHQCIESDEEVQEIMKRYSMKSKSEFPIYYTTDMVVKYFHWKPGTVVRIFRHMGSTREPELYYRHVIDP